LRTEITADFFKILIAYFMYLPAFLSFKFGWAAHITFFYVMTDSEHILNFDFTGTLRTGTKLLPHGVRCAWLHAMKCIPGMCQILHLYCK